MIWDGVMAGLWFEARVGVGVGVAIGVGVAVGVGGRVGV